MGRRKKQVQVAPAPAPVPIKSREDELAKYKEQQGYPLSEDHHKQQEEDDEDDEDDEVDELKDDELAAKEHVKNETLYPALKPIRGSTIHMIWFRSKMFIDTVENDIKNLLDRFATEWELEQQTKSPFQVFRKVWSSLGWENVHLLVLEPSWRPEWIRTICRIFVDKINPENPDIYQIGGLFGFYVFWATQPYGSSEYGYRTYIPIDERRISIIRSIPNRLAHVVDKQDQEQNSFLESKNSDDLNVVVDYLIKNQVFFLSPSQVVDHPELGNVTVKDLRSGESDAASKILIAISNELNSIFPSPSSKPEMQEEQDQEQELEQKQAFESLTSASNFIPWLNTLEQTKRQYIMSKSQVSAVENGSSLSQPDLHIRQLINQACSDSMNHLRKQPDPFVQELVGSGDKDLLNLVNSDSVQAPDLINVEIEPRVSLSPNSLPHQ